MHDASRLALPWLRVRVFSPLAKLWPLQAPRGGRALSEDFSIQNAGANAGIVAGLRGRVQLLGRFGRPES